MQKPRSIYEKSSQVDGIKIPPVIEWPLAAGTGRCVMAGPTSETLTRHRASDGLGCVGIQVAT